MNKYNQYLGQFFLLLLLFENKNDKGHYFRKVTIKFFFLYIYNPKNCEKHIWCFIHMCSLKIIIIKNKYHKIVSSGFFNATLHQVNFLPSEWCEDMIWKVLTWEKIWTFYEVLARHQQHAYRTSSVQMYWPSMQLNNCRFFPNYQI